MSCHVMSCRVMSCHAEISFAINAFGHVKRIMFHMVSLVRHTYVMSWLPSFLRATPKQHSCDSDASARISEMHCIYNDDDCDYETCKP